MPAVKTRARRKAPQRSRASRAPTDGWWGDGPAPWTRWPGVTIQLDAAWCGERGRWESPDGRFYYDPDAGQKYCEFFPEFLRHHKGEFGPSEAHPEGQPFYLLPYQDLLIIRPLFGWKRTRDGLRRFRKVFLAVPKGNGKSPLGAGIGLALTFCDGEEGAEVYAAAADRDQAAVVFDTAKIMVEQSPELLELASVYRRLIEVSSTNSRYRVLSAEARTKHGPNIHGLVFDEFHAQRSRDLYETLYRGTVKRRQPVIVMITTAGDDEESICAEEWDYARKVISGTHQDETYLPIIFEASKDDDWKDPAVWRRVNPGFGITVKEDAIIAECQAAQNEPRKLHDFLRYHCNRWVNQATAWIPVDWWDNCKAPLDLAQLAQYPCCAGLDLAQKYDLAALVLAFKLPLVDAPEPTNVEIKIQDEAGTVVTQVRSLNYRVALVPFFWIPEATMREHERSDRVPYRQWESNGLVRATEGDVIDYDRIFQDITTEIAPQFPLLHSGELGYDPAYAMELALRLQGSGFKPVEIVQGYKHMSEPCQVFEAFVRSRRVLHDGHPILRWNVENSEIKTDDSGRIRPVKSIHARKRIDGLVASVMALSRLMFAPDLGPSTYETNDLLVL